MRLTLTIASSFVVLAAAALAQNDLANVPKVWPRCDSDIYCHGDLLKTVQLSGLFSDSKTFVDMPTKVPSDQVLKAWSKLTSSHPNGTIPNDQLKSFVDQYFHPAGTEVVPGRLPDFVKEPEFLEGVSDLTLRGFAQHLNAFWPNLTKRVDMSTICEGCESTLIAPKNDFIVPGGRFREFYYWDTYFTFQGMLLSGLNETARGMLENFFEQVRTLGFVPNGARIYYKNRSQPPFLVQMVKSYIDFTGDESILEEGLPMMDREWNFLQANTSIVVKHPKTGKKYKMNHWNVLNDLPRPEGFYPDWQTVEMSNLTTKAKKQLYAELANGAESGLDYTARWLNERDNLNKTDPPSILRSLAVSRFIPADLNALLYMNERQLAEWHSALGHDDKAEEYDEAADHRYKGVVDLLWNEDLNAFRDFNLTSNAHSEVWSLTDYWPYWARIYPKGFGKKKGTVEKAFEHVRELLDKFPGALPTTDLDTTLQWDFPNAWPPLTHALSQAVLSVYEDFGQDTVKETQKEKRADVEEDLSHFELLQRRREQRRQDQRLRRSRIYRRNIDTSTKKAVGVARSTHVKARKPETTSGGDPFRLYSMARDVAQHHIASAACGWYSTGGSVSGHLDKLPGATDEGHMFEKFDATKLGASGHGGEYEVQAGFGWTNGVVMWQLYQFGDELEWPDCPEVAQGAKKRSF